MKKPIKQTSDGSAPIWQDADGEYISYEDITEILNSLCASDANEPYLVSSDVCSDTEIAVARSCGRFFTIGSFGYVVRVGQSSPGGAPAEGTTQNGLGDGAAPAQALLADVCDIEIRERMRLEEELRKAKALLVEVEAYQWARLEDAKEEKDVLTFEVVSALHDKVVLFLGREAPV